ncbi:hypothetical protein SAMN04489761_3428 [Tenacibaculum sp. MAR_2009_124]|uniref:hypothetical protein n=1 Tax=Tenacibaculum sp. MAR_2009_124 TaxID=1250059 RepID=UPI00089BFA18|nr:hypothetical protein [Tenacibaculum sp. MAR_2009_124]SEC66046.1 hypothetical protein SAMN04489761_3428 [Tenacibaculum sp. MAR_2009_124]
MIIEKSNFLSSNHSNKIYLLKGNKTVSLSLEELNSKIENLPKGEKVIDFFPGPKGEDLIETKVQ